MNPIERLIDQLEHHHKLLGGFSDGHSETCETRAQIEWLCKKAKP
jgi:hypothetical protein